MDSSYNLNKPRKYSKSKNQRKSYMYQFGANRPGKKLTVIN